MKCTFGLLKKVKNVKTRRLDMSKEEEKAEEIVYTFAPILNLKNYDEMLGKWVDATAKALRAAKLEGWNKAIEAAKMVSLKYGEDTGNEYEPTAIANEIEKLRRTE